MASWVKFCPNYEIILWNESKFDISSTEFTKKHYENKNYAFVSDYVRMYALYHHGGIYLDTDVEIKNNLDCFLIHEAFAGFESKKIIQTAVLGCKPGHVITEVMIKHYNKMGYRSSQEANTLTISNIILEKFRIKENRGDVQAGYYSGDSIAIYPPEFFCIECTSNYAVHHFHGSWLRENESSVKDSIKLRYHLEQALLFNDSGEELIKAAAHALKLRDILRILIRKVYYLITPNAIDAWIKNNLR